MTYKDQVREEWKKVQLQSGLIDIQEFIDRALDGLKKEILAKWPEEAQSRSRTGDQWNNALSAARKVVEEV